MATVLTIAAFAAVSVSCSKDEEDEESNSLTGRWVYSSINYNFFIDGEWYDAGELGFDDTDNSFRGTSFTFRDDGTVSLSYGGITSEGRYEVSGDIISMGDDEITLTMRYHVSGKTLELIWDSVVMENMGVPMDEFYEAGIEDIEMILTFTRN
jgi:hypothetical protein